MDFHIYNLMLNKERDRKTEREIIKLVRHGKDRRKGIFPREPRNCRKRPVNLNDFDECKGPSIRVSTRLPALLLFSPDLSPAHRRASAG